MAKTKKRKSQKDFQKVKLKVGRKVKPANETVPHVKIGRIQIRDQFSSVKDDPGAKRDVKVRVCYQYSGFEMVKFGSNNCKFSDSSTELEKETPREIIRILIFFLYLVCSLI